MSESPIRPILLKNGVIGCEGRVFSSIIPLGDDMRHGSPPFFFETYGPD